MLIIRDCFSYRVVKIPNEFANAELVCVDLSTDHSTYRIIVYYRSGGFDSEAVNYAIESIKCLYYLCSIKYTICLCGDFNLPAFNWTYHTAPNNSIYRVFLASTTAGSINLLHLLHVMITSLILCFQMTLSLYHQLKCSALFQPVTTMSLFLGQTFSANLTITSHHPHQPITLRKETIY